MRLRAALPLALLTACSSPASTETSTQPIVGGRSDAGGHGYVVGVGDASGAFCSGTVISAHTVITAGHCFSQGQPNGGITRVFFGATVDPPSKADQTITVAEAIREPGFSGSTLHNDLTILRLASPAPVQPAPLLREDMGSDASFVGPNFTWVGYGVTNGNTQTGFGVRRVVVFPIAAVGPATVGGSVGDIDATQFYYDTPAKNTCNGDSGGPGFAIRNGVERHAGTTSFGDGPCKLDGVQQRTDLPQITAFLQAHIDTFENMDACRSDGTCNESCQDGQTELVDPDCAENHCGADGICALSCVAPIDPDCVIANVNHCASDGVCDPSCSTLDPDCTPLCAADGTCIPTCPTRDTDCGPPGGCGDGVLDTGEQCDDGNQDDTDGCRNDCTLPGCGDGIVEAGEQCDDQNDVDSDACLSNCQLARCGDGVLEAGVEQCDDGNTTDGDGCSSTCTIENHPTDGACGDGTVDPNEECDDGNTKDHDGCSSTCTREVFQAPVCGDGVLSSLEECDDGNTESGDGCSQFCEIETGGNGSCAAGGGAGWLVGLGVAVALTARRRTTRSRR